MFEVLAHFLGIISTRRNKRDGHTTLGSIFIAANVSCVRFFVVQSGSESILLRLLQNSSILRKRQQNLVNALTLSCSKKISRGLHNVSAVLAYVFRIIPIHRNKNYDHQTHITIFIVRNVSRVRFFGGSERIRANLNHFGPTELKTHQKRTKVWWTL